MSSARCRLPQAVLPLRGFVQGVYHCPPVLRRYRTLVTPPSPPQSRLRGGSRRTGLTGRAGGQTRGGRCRCRRQPRAADVASAAPGSCVTFRGRFEHSENTLQLISGTNRGMRDSHVMAESLTASQVTGSPRCCPEGDTHPPGVPHGTWQVTREQPPVCPCGRRRFCHYRGSRCPHGGSSRSPSTGSASPRRRRRRPSRRGPPRRSAPPRPLGEEVPAFPARWPPSAPAALGGGSFSGFHPRRGA